MRASALKTVKRVEEFKDSSFQIRRWGKNNDYPDKINEIRAASGTAQMCVNLYKKFICGQGFVNESLNEIEIYPGFTLFELLMLNGQDLAEMGGFAVHRNLNALKQPVNYQFAPIDFLRFQIEMQGRYAEPTGRYKLHQSWGGRVMNIKPQVGEVIIIDPFTDSELKIDEQIIAAGGIETFNGQIFYYSNVRNGYPIPIYDAIISDMSTEDSVATVKNRNAKNNFLPAGAFVTKGKNSEKGEAELGDDEPDTEAGMMIESLQGDENSFNIAHIELDYNEEMPTFIEFPIKDGDKLYELTERTVQQNIGNGFMQPPVLRGQLIAGKLGTASEIQDAMKYYNFITKPERQVIEQAYKKLFMNFEPLKGVDFSIKPLEFV